MFGSTAPLCVPTIAWQSGIAVLDDASEKTFCAIAKEWAATHFRINGDDEFAGVLGVPSRVVIILETEMSPGQSCTHDLDHERDRRALVGAERQQCTALDHSVGIGGRPAVAIE